MGHLTMRDKAVLVWEVGHGCSDCTRDTTLCPHPTPAVSQLLPLSMVPQSVPWRTKPMQMEPRRRSTVTAVSAPVDTGSARQWPVMVSRTEGRRSGQSRDLNERRWHGCDGAKKGQGLEVSGAPQPPPTTPLGSTVGGALALDASDIKIKRHQRRENGDPEHQWMSTWDWDNHHERKRWSVRNVYQHPSTVLCLLTNLILVTLKEILYRKESGGQKSKGLNLPCHAGKKKSKWKM